MCGRFSSSACSLPSLPPCSAQPRSSASRAATCPVSSIAVYACSRASPTRLPRSGPFAGDRHRTWSGGQVCERRHSSGPNVLKRSIGEFLNLRSSVAATERGLSLHQRLDGRQGRRHASRARVDSWRRADQRLGYQRYSRRRSPREKGHRAGLAQLPPRSAWLSRAPTADGGIAAAFVGQLRRAGSNCGAALGAEEHRRVRWRSGER